MHPTHTLPTLAVGDPTPADILRGAARYIQLHGWHQGNFYPLDHGPFPPACAAGAIRVAVCGRPVRYLENLDHHEQRLVTRTEQFLAAHLDPDRTPEVLGGPFSVIGDWNDLDWRNSTEVIDTLTDAAGEWDRIHGGAR